MFDSLRVLKNETLALGDLVKDAPGAVWTEIHNDYKAHPWKKAGEAVVSAVAGAAAYIGIRKAPVFMEDLSTTVAITTAPLTYEQLRDQVKKFWTNGGNFISAAKNADSGEQREKLAQTYSKKLGRDLAPLVETGAPMLAGGVAADRLLALAPNANTFLTETVMQGKYGQYSTNLGEFGYRRLTGGGLVRTAADDLRARILNSSSFINQDGTQNLLAASDSFNKGGAGMMNKFWLSREPQAEVAREIDMERGAMTSAYRGTESETTTGRELHDLTSGHTHPPRSGPGASVEDVVRQQGVGFIQSGKMRGFYAGQLDTYGAGIKANLPADAIVDKHGAPRLFELILDDDAAEPHAFYITREAERVGPNQYRWADGSPTYVDYDKAKDLLTHAPRDAGAFENSVRALPDAEQLPVGVAYFRNLAISTRRSVTSALENAVHNLGSH